MKSIAVGFIAQLEGQSHEERDKGQRHKAENCFLLTLVSLSLVPMSLRR
jgi:hypothetical protein